MAIKAYLLTEQAYDVVKQDIFEQTLSPSQRIVITSVANDLECSLSSVREALFRLRAEGLVDYSPNQGFQVAPLLGTKSFDDLYDTRRLIEPHAAQIAARTITSRDLDELREALLKMRSCSEEPVFTNFQPFMESDAKFHQRIFEVAGNSILLELYDHLHVHLHLSRLYRVREIVDVDAGCEEHAQILQSLESRDEKRVYEAVKDHIEGSYNRLRWAADSSKGV